MPRDQLSNPKGFVVKFRVERDHLADAAAWVSRQLPARPAVPVLGGVLVESADEGLALSGFDYETSTRTTVPATVADEDRVLVSARLLADITKALPRKPVEVVADGPRVTIHCGPSRFSLPSMPVEDYPALPAMPDLAGTVAGETLAEAVAQVAVAAGRDDSLPMLTGIRLEIDGDRITLAATDRFRLAVREIAWEPKDPALKVAVLIPARTLAEIAKHLAHVAHVELALTAGEGMIGFTGAGRRATTRLLDAEFPRFRQLIPAEHSSAVTVDVEPLITAIKRVSLACDRTAWRVASEAATQLIAQIRLDFTADGLKLAAGGDDIASAEEQIPADLDGDPITTAYNPGYLLDALGSLPTGRARLTFTTPNRPGLVRPVPAMADTELDDQLMLLMPVRIGGQS